MEYHTSLALHSNRDFRRLWLSRCLSLLGGRASGVAITLLVLTVSDDPVLAGIASASYAVGFVAGQLPAGWITDRYDRKIVLLVSESIVLSSALAIAAMTLAGHFWFPLAGISVVAHGVAFGTLKVAEDAALPSVVGSHKLTQAATLNQARTYTAQLAGPPAGGALFGLGRAIPFLGNAVTSSISLILLARLRVPLRDAPPAASTSIIESTLTSTVQGLRRFWSTPFIRVTGLLTAMSDAIVNMLPVVIIVAAQQSGLNSLQVGLVIGCGSGGGVLGALITSRYTHYWPPPSMFIILVPLLSAGLLATLATLVEGMLIGLPYALLFVAWPLWQGMVTARWLTLVQDSERGRTIAAVQLIGSALSILAPILGGILIETIGVKSTLLVAASGMLVLSGIAAFPPTHRTIVRHEYDNQSS